MERPPILHILTKPGDPLADAIISAQKSDSDRAVEVVDLSSGEPDYAALVEKIFAAASIEVW
jgi:hypothetical protein